MSPLIREDEVCSQLGCKPWFLKALCKLYGLRRLGDKANPVYRIADVEAAYVAHADDGHPTKKVMQKRIQLGTSDVPKHVPVGTEHVPKCPHLRQVLERTQIGETIREACRAVAKTAAIKEDTLRKKYQRWLKVN